MSGVFSRICRASSKAPFAKMSAITLQESGDLLRLEKIVAQGLQTFVEVGEALAEISDRKLYRIEHHSFDDYLESKWKISRSRASRLIQAAEVVKLLPVGNKPTTERQARPLTKLAQEKRAEAWSAAVKESPTGTPTARAVAAVVAKRTGKAAETDKTPLQWLTHYWVLASDEDHRLFDNFREGWRGGR